jgi:uncharacterized membrane protein
VSDVASSTDDRAARAQLELAALALIAVACVVNLVLPAGTGRTIVTLLAALTVPGAAVMIRMPISDPVQGVALVAGLSLAVEVAVTLVMAWTGWWHPVAAAAALAGVTAAVLCADLVREMRWVP